MGSRLTTISNLPRSQISCSVQQV